MKAIMYHYVREPDPDGPRLRALDVADFRRQLDFFESRFRLPTLPEFLRVMEGRDEPAEDMVVLTFDDGLRDHHRYVLPELVERGTFGIFYVATQPLQQGRALSVHLTHLLVASVGAGTLLEQIRDIVDGSRMSADAEEAFASATYSGHADDPQVKAVKRLLNYALRYEARDVVLEALMSANGLTLPVEDFYLSDRQIREMHDAGMLIGSHTVSHPVMSQLSAEAQREEIHESFRFLDSLLGGLEVRTYGHPYGGDHSFDPDTEAALEGEGCRFSFSVESRDVRALDLTECPHALPRYDCNDFPHGAAMGS